MKAYPIKFKPILKEKIWGGKKLRELLGKTVQSNHVGESWEISGVEDNISTVANGALKNLSIIDLIKMFKGDFLGEQNFKNFGENFPLLIKFLDANTNLSVQVHPDDVMAKKHHNSFGKTEMWYVMDCDRDAEIILGLNKGVKGNNELASINERNVASIFNTEKVEKGDCYFIPAGKVHAIGAGVLAAEIQQTSDITYRIYDWDRRDKYGRKRALHTRLAKEATKNFPSNDRNDYTLISGKSSNLVSCDFFTTNIIKVDRVMRKKYHDLDSFVIFMCVDGAAKIIVDNIEETIKMGETVLIPASSELVYIQARSAKILEIYIDG